MGWRSFRHIVARVTAKPRKARPMRTSVSLIARAAGTQKSIGKKENEVIPIDGA
jgi:hypothetical protein